MRRPRPLVAALEYLRERGTIERTDPILALKIQKVEHAARLVHEGHQLDAFGVENPIDFLSELLSSSTLLPADSSLLFKRQKHRMCNKNERQNDFD